MINVFLKFCIFMRPSSLGGGRIYCVALCPSVCPSVPLSLPPVTSFRQPLASRMYFSARTEGRISYGHLGRTDSCSNLRFVCYRPRRLSNLQILQRRTADAKFGLFRPLLVFVLCCEFFTGVLPTLQNWTLKLEDNENSCHYVNWELLRVN